MKNTFLIFIVLFCFMNCSVKKHYLSTLENIKIFPANKADSAKIDAYNDAGNRQAEECLKLKNVICIDDSSNMYLHAQFPKGVYNFRIILFNNFKLPKDALEGENRIRITVGTNNTIDNIEILKYTDENTRKAIEDVFRLKELNTWKSAKIYGIPVKEQFEISIFVTNK
ncbi:hypothetical protein [Chryseobacterium indoltheticum]|uniref:Uncharacterized protein n=1 Tax=Chryseobacterium indoltheticum TaxID=254 RepID=A0A381JT51_9FLAO|nr:hypothetical protein [Chryseobacterium indoltheticum]SIQ46158.1 hypothetical protein SAMN05421682_105108 [Chryseobacterium indoltheticum]SUY53779.1 Uncharacterised protein [Chryseobacterium indoltheticum]